MNRFSRLRIGLAVLFIIFSLVTPSWAQNTPPVADAGGPYAGTAGSAITFDGSGSYDSDKGDQIVLYEWDLDYDGKYEVQGKTVNKTFASATSGRVQLRVWDSHQASDTDTAS
jgi:hypothetical protein